MEVIFLGTPSFAVPVLETVTKTHNVTLVVTQPDRPKGRGRELAASPVKLAATRLGLPVYQPERIRRPEAQARLASLKPEIMVVVGYGQIIPQSVIDIAPRGIINVHASLLPKYRGAAPIQWAIARGESRTGVTTMRINAGLDTGDMLLKWETEIEPEETAVGLGERLAIAGADLLIRTLAELPSIQPQPQDDSQATYAPILKKEDGHLDWSQTRREILNRIRGLVPWPGCYGFLRGARLHVWRAREADAALARGTLEVGKRRLLVGCGDGSIEILEVQMEGKKRMDAAAFLNGSPVQTGEVLA